MMILIMVRDRGVKIKTVFFASYGVVVRKKIFATESTSKWERMWLLFLGWIFFFFFFLNVHTLIYKQWVIYHRIFSNIQLLWAIEGVGVNIKLLFLGWIFLNFDTHIYPDVRVMKNLISHFRKFLRRLNGLKVVGKNRTFLLGRTKWE